MGQSLTHLLPPQLPRCQKCADVAPCQHQRTSASCRETRILLPSNTFQKFRVDLGKHLLAGMSWGKCAFLTWDLWTHCHQLKLGNGEWNCNLYLSTEATTELIMFASASVLLTADRYAGFIWIQDSRRQWGAINPDRRVIRIAQECWEWIHKECSALYIT